MSYDAPTLQEFLDGYEIAVPLEDTDNYRLIAYRYYKATGYFHMRDLSYGGMCMSQDTFTMQQATTFYLYVAPNPQEYAS
jgi:hypothetical protein